MNSNEPITFGTRHYDCTTNYAAVCCGHVHWREKLIRSQVISGKLIVNSAKCLFCGDQLVFGEWNGEKNNLECGNKQLGKVLSIFNRPCKVIKAKKYCLNEEGKVWLVRVIKWQYGNDANYYVVPHDRPEMTGCIDCFYSEKEFTEYLKLISQTEFDCYFTSQRFDL